MNLFQILCVFSVLLYSHATVKRQSSNNYYTSTPSYGNQYGNSQYGNSQYGNTPYGNNQYGNSQFGGQYGNSQYNPQYGMMYDTGSQGIDAIILTFALPKLMGQLNTNDMMSLNRTIASLQGANGNQIVPIITQWANQLNPTTKQQVQGWLQDQMSATQMAQQKGTQLVNQNNISANVRNAWQQLQRLVTSMTVTSSQFSSQLNQIYNSLSSTDKRQFEQIFQQVYGYSLTQYFVPVVNTQALQNLYQQNMGNGVFRDLSYGNNQYGYNSNSLGYNNQMMYNNQNPNQYNQGYGYNSNSGYPYSFGNNVYGTQYSATGYAAPYTFNAAYGRRPPYRVPPMAPAMPVP